MKFISLLAIARPFWVVDWLAAGLWRRHSAPHAGRKNAFGARDLLAAFCGGAVMLYPLVSVFVMTALSHASIPRPHLSCTSAGASFEIIGVWFSSLVAAYGAAPGRKLSGVRSCHATIRAVSFRLLDPLAA